MYLKSKIFVSQKFPWHRPLFSILYAFLVSVVYKNTNWIDSIPLSIPSIIGTAISLFLGFRTNSAYQRWWEARKIWGEIVNNSRTLSRQVLTFGHVSPNLELRKSIVKRQIYWCWILAYKLRGVKPHKLQKEYITKSEKDNFKNSTNVPNKILFIQQLELSKLQQCKSISNFEFLKMESTISLLCNSMGKCERIKNTVFPMQYSLYTKIFLYIFLLIFPLSIVEYLGYFTAIIQFLIGFTFIMIQNIAMSLQNPFDNQPSDISMFAISRTIERNLLEMIEKQEYPSDWEVKDNVLM